jgi:hypothetical protein
VDFKVSAFESPQNKRAPSFSVKMPIVVVKKSKNALHEKQNGWHRSV